MTENSELPGDQLRGWASFLDAHTLVERALEQYLHDNAGVSHAEYEILSRLNDSAERRMRMGELAAALFSPGSRLNYRITRLAGLGLVRREQHPTDRRGLYAVLTDEGVQFLRRVRPGYVNAVRQSVLAAVDEREFAELGRISRKIFRHLLQEPDGGPQRGG
jgi:DNA-binding MarR family transcriptional regulator